VTAKHLRLAVIKPTKAAEERGISTSVTHTILDTTQQTILFVEAFGRISRVVAAKEDIPPSES
jgi:hypothetical protein